VHSSLLRALRIVVRADSDPARQALFANLMRARPLVRLVFELHETMRGSWPSAALVAGYGLCTALRVALPRPRPLVVVAVHENARRAAARIASWVGDDDCAWVQTRLTLSGVWAARRLTVRHVRRGVRVLRAIDRRHGFLVACRAADAIAWYARGRAILGAGRPGAVLVSSDSNPEEIGFAGAARALGVPTVFVSHAYSTPLTPPLDFTLSILEGEAAVRARRQKGPIAGRVLLGGVEGDSAPLDVARFRRPHPVIGIFTPKAISWPTLAAIIDACRRHYHPRQVIIRWHPSMIEEPRLYYVLHDRSGVIESPRGAALDDVARQCDWVIADENSNVHLPVLKRGIPTVAVGHLGIYPDSRADQYGFVAHGIILPPLRSVTDVDGDDLAAFFDEAWCRRFREYDASYLRPGDALAAEIRVAVRELLGLEQPVRIEEGAQA
jgi:hypothetical protein